MFTNSVDIKAVYIPSTLTLTNGVFSGCSKLKDVTIYGDDFSIASTDYNPSTGEGSIVATVKVTDAELIKKLTDTYSNYLWIRNINFSK